MQSLARLADEQRADEIRVQLKAQTTGPEATVAQAAVRALTELDVRFGGGSQPNRRDPEFGLEIAVGDPQHGTHRDLTAPYPPGAARRAAAARTATADRRGGENHDVVGSRGRQGRQSGRAVAGAEASTSRP